MAETRTEDAFGRQIQIAVANESEDGTGVWHAVKVNTSGELDIVVDA